MWAVCMGIEKRGQAGTGPNKNHKAKAKKKAKIGCVDTSKQNANFAFGTQNMKKYFSRKKRKICVLRGHPNERGKFF